MVAVDDGVYTRNLVGQQVLLQRPNDRDAPANAGLIQQVGPILSGQLDQLGALLRHELLVCGNGVFALGEDRRQEVHGWVHATDELHNNVHLRTVHNIGGVCREKVAGHARCLKLGGIDIRRAAQHDGSPHLMSKPLSLMQQDSSNLTTYDTEAKNAHPDAAVFTHAGLPPDLNGYRGL